MRLNITEKTSSVIQEMVDNAFDLNSHLDRMKSCLNADFNYVNSSKVIHNMAHKYAFKIGDNLGDLIEDRGVSVKYGGVVRKDQVYNNVQEIFLELRDIVIDFENKLNMCAKIAFDNMDIHIYEGLLEIIEDHKEYVNQTDIWAEKSLQYGDKPSFDVHIIKYTDEEFL